MMTITNFTHIVELQRIMFQQHTVLPTDVILKIQGFFLPTAEEIKEKTEEFSNVCSIILRNEGILNFSYLKRDPHLAFQLIGDIFKAYHFRVEIVTSRGLLGEKEVHLGFFVDDSSFISLNSVTGNTDHKCDEEYYDELYDEDDTYFCSGDFTEVVTGFVSEINSPEWISRAMRALLILSEVNPKKVDMPVLRRLFLSDEEERFHAQYGRQRIPMLREIYYYDLDDHPYDDLEEDPNRHSYDDLYDHPYD